MDDSFFGREKISKIILKIAPPVMLAQLIQALYNIVDSLFIGHYSDKSLTALSIIYPIQLLMIAFGVGTGVGINTKMSYSLGLKKADEANKTAGVGLFLGLIMWAFFAGLVTLFLPTYARMQTDSVEVINDVISYGRITCIFSIGLFLESIWTKVIQAHGDMKTPMIAQIIGAVVNIVCDPLLIFGIGFFPEMGIAGAGIATVLGQIVAALVVMKKGFKKSPKLKTYPKEILKIYQLGIPNILMQAAYTFYIFGLNLILARFSDQAVTALGLYYKWQTFFFIPLGALQTCIVPVIGYNYSSGNIKRCKDALNTSLLYGLVLMFLGTLCFEFLPRTMLHVFTNDLEVLRIGTVGFRIIGISFIPLVTSLIYPVFFQAVGKAVASSMLTFVRTLFLFVPLGYLFSLIGLNYFWLTFPISELLTSLIGFIFYKNFLKKARLEFENCD